MVVRIHTVEALERLRDQWDDLLKASASDCFFLTWEWLFTWWKHLSGGRELFILAVYSAETLIALAPFAIRTGRFGTPVVEFLGSGVVGSDYLDLIVRSGCERQAIESLAQYL